MVELLPAILQIAGTLVKLYCVSLPKRVRRINTGQSKGFRCSFHIGIHGLPRPRLRAVSAFKNELLASLSKEPLFQVFWKVNLPFFFRLAFYDCKSVLLYLICTELQDVRNPQSCNIQRLTN